MKCEYCDRMNDEKSNICKYCGAPLKNTASQQSQHYDGYIPFAEMFLGFFGLVVISLILSIFIISFF